MAYRITAESFGSELPEDWEEIADRLNSIIERRGIADDREAVDELWEQYWRGEVDFEEGR